MADPDEPRVPGRPDLPPPPQGPEEQSANVVLPRLSPPPSMEAIHGRQAVPEPSSNAYWVVAALALLGGAAAVAYVLR